jgi:hypothetical protein
MARVGAAALLAGALTVTLAAVPASSTGLVALLGPPDPARLGAALILLVVAVRSREWAFAAPLAATLVPLALPRVAAAWTFSGAGALVPWAFALALTVRTWPWTRLTTLRPGVQAAAAGAAAAVWLGAVGVAVAPFAVTGDAPHYLTIARSLVEDGDVDLRDDYDDRSYRDFYGGSLEPRHTNLSPWGEQYSFHGLGAAVLVTPGFAVFGVAGAVATLVGVMAAGAALTWLAAWHLLGHAGAAWFGSAALTLSAPYGLHAAAVYPDGPAAVPIAGALWLAARRHSGRHLSLSSLAAVGAGLATLPWLHVRLALPAGIWGLALAVAVLRGPGPRWPQLAWLFAAPIVSCAGWFASSQVMFGTWDPTAVMLQRTAPGGWGDALRGLLGLVADHQYGLIVAAPSMAAAVAAAPRVVRRWPVLGVASAATVLGVLLMSSAWVWWGGDAAPARFLTVTLPIFAIWLAERWVAAGEGARRVLVLLLAATAAFTVGYAMVDGGARAYAFPDGRGSMFEAFSPAVDLSLALPSLFRPGESAAEAAMSALVWIVCCGGAAWAAARVPVGGRDAHAAAMAGLVLLIGAAVAAQAAWAVRAVSPWTPATGALALVRHASTAWTMTGGASWWPGQRRLDGIRLTTPESIPVGPPVLLYVPGLPAGQYELHAPRPARGQTFRLELGRDAWPFVEWGSADDPPSLDLRAAVHSVRVVGAGADAADAWLQPRGMRRGPPGEARRVTRTPAGDLYSMDDGHYPEPSGAWTGGDRSTRWVLVPPFGETAVDVGLEAGPARVEVQLTSGGATRPLTLEPFGRERVRLQHSDGAVEVVIAVRGGFPASALGSPSDSRTLGVWMDFSAATRR